MFIAHLEFSSIDNPTAKLEFHIEMDLQPYTHKLTQEDMQNLASTLAHGDYYSGYDTKSESYVAIKFKPGMIMKIIGIYEVSHPKPQWPV